MYLAVLAIADSVRPLLENCLTSKENHVARHELDEYETKIQPNRKPHLPL